MTDAVVSGPKRSVLFSLLKGRMLTYLNESVSKLPVPIFASTHSASNSHFLLSFSLVLLLFYFGGWLIRWPALSSPPSPPSWFLRLLLHLSTTALHWVPTPPPAALCSSHTWRNGHGALPVAGGAATTGKDATVTLTLRTPVQFWRNSVSPVISLSLCLFAVTPLLTLPPALFLHPAAPSLHAFSS